MDEKDLEDWLDSTFEPERTSPIEESEAIDRNSDWMFKTKFFKGGNS